MVIESVVVSGAVVVSVVFASVVVAAIVSLAGFVAGDGAREFVFFFSGNQSPSFFLVVWMDVRFRCCD